MNVKRFCGYLLSSKSQASATAFHVGPGLRYKLGPIPLPPSLSRLKRHPCTQSNNKRKGYLSSPPAFSLLRFCFRIQNPRSRVDRFRGRLVVPIRDHRGLVIGFGARDLSDSQVRGRRKLGVGWGGDTSWQLGGKRRGGLVLGRDRPSVCCCGLVLLLLLLLLPVLLLLLWPLPLCLWCYARER